MTLSYTGPHIDRPASEWTLTGVLSEQAKSRGNRPLLKWTASGRPILFAEADTIATRYAAAFAAAGIRADDRVVLFMENSLTHVWCWLGLNRIGAVDAPINPAYFGRLLVHQISLVKPVMIVCDASLKDRLDAVTDALDPPGLGVFVNSAADRGSTAGPDETLSLKEGAPIAFSAKPSDIASILYTSGTTGPSKGVRVPNAQLYFFSEQTAALHRMTEDDVYLAPYPLFHASARVHGIGSCLVRGACCVLYDKFSASAFSERVADSRATVTHFLGSMVKLILNQPVQPSDARSRLRSVMAVPLPTSIMDDFRKRFGVENAAEIIGLTEASWPVMSPYGVRRPAGAAGLPVSQWFEIAILGPEDQEVGINAVGELAVRPKQAFTILDAYENMPEQTVRAFRNLWFHTGDLVRRDADGWIYFVDRLKDSIRRRGENISSFEIEQVLLAFGGIRDAAVVAHRNPGEERDEELLAVLVCDGDNFDIESLFRHLRAELPSFARPRYFRIVDALPVTDTGKIAKEVLRQQGLGETPIEWF